MRDPAPRSLSPDGLRRLLHEGPCPVGEARALAVLRINRTTLGRWLAGSVKVPHAAALVLRQMADGIPPEGTESWRGFQWAGDALVTPSGDTLTARQLDGLHWPRWSARWPRSKARLTGCAGLGARRTMPPRGRWRRPRRLSS
jgi:hypothetical protein